MKPVAMPRTSSTMNVVELARELKAAGYPQGPLPHSVQCQHAARQHVHIPFLEELIEACGDDLESITHDFSQAATDDEWVACSSYEKLERRGQNPLEAVARLWIALKRRTVD